MDRLLKCSTSRKYSDMHIVNARNEECKTLCAFLYVRNDDHYMVYRASKGLNNTFPALHRMIRKSSYDIDMGRSLEERKFSMPYDTRKNFFFASERSVSDEVKAELLSPSGNSDSFKFFFLHEVSVFPETDQIVYDEEELNQKAKRLAELLDYRLFEIQTDWYSNWIENPRHMIEDSLRKQKMHIINHRKKPLEKWTAFLKTEGQFATRKGWEPFSGHGYLGDSLVWKDSKKEITRDCLSVYNQWFSDHTKDRKYKQKAIVENENTIVINLDVERVGSDGVLSFYTKYLVYQIFVDPDTMKPTSTFAPWMPL